MELSRLSQFSRLFRDYVSSTSTPASQFFAHPPSIEGLDRLIESRLSEYASDARDAIASVLRTQMAERASSAAIKANLAHFAKPGTLAVVTGQQVGILGGPLYSIYKSLTAIGIARELSVRYPKQKFVPIFWLETEDHDIDEVRSIGLLNKEAELRTVEYSPPGYDGASESWRKPMGSLPLEEPALSELWDRLEAELLPTEYTKEVLAKLRSVYSPGKTFGQAFAQLLTMLFADEGLLVLDANNREVKSLASHLFRKELETSPALSDAVILQSVQVEEHYHAQVKPKPVNLFMLEHGERFSILQREKSAADQEFFLKGTRRTFTLPELITLTSTEPERFSPNVVMRPLMQDTVLPTIAYIGGPGEIAYFAQFKPAYEWAGISMPVIYPRASMTIVEDRTAKNLEKFGLTAEALLEEGIAAIDAYINSVAAESLEVEFAAIEAEVDKDLEVLRATVNRVDKTLDQSLTGLKGKMLTAFRDFKGKTLSVARKQHQSSRQQLERALSTLLPDGAMQEREISPVFLANKYGWEFLNDLKRSVLERTGREREHHVLTVGEIAGSGDKKTGQKSAEVRTSEGAESLMAVPDEQGVSS